MKETIIIALFQEHYNSCWYKNILKLVKDENLCTFCYQVNRDISIMISRIEGARRLIDVGIALPDCSKLNEYLPYEKAGFIIFTNTGITVSERLYNVFNRAFKIGYKKVIIVSHRTPNLPPKYIETAVKRMNEGSQIIIGPLSNGGLYLIGMSNHVYNKLVKKETFNKINFDTSKLEILKFLVKVRFLTSLYTLPKWYQLKSINDFKKITFKNYKNEIAWNATWTRQILRRYLNNEI